MDMDEMRECENVWMKCEFLKKSGGKNRHTRRRPTFVSFEIFDFEELTGGLK